MVQKRRFITDTDEENKKTSPMARKLCLINVGPVSLLKNTGVKPFMVNASKTERVNGIARTVMSVLRRLFLKSVSGAGSQKQATTADKCKIDETRVAVSLIVELVLTPQ